jgi:hypothetical protein
MEEKKIYPVCRRCGRKLKTDEAKELGFGPVCLLKAKTEKRNPLFGGKNAESNSPVSKQEQDI